MITVPERADPVVQELFRRANAKGLQYKHLARTSGVSQDALAKWQQGTSPVLANLVAALEVVGLRLTVEEVEQ